MAGITTATFLNTPVQHPAYCQIHFDAALDEAIGRADAWGVRVIKSRNKCRECDNDGLYYLTYVPGGAK